MKSYEEPTYFICLSVVFVTKFNSNRSIIPNRANRSNCSNPKLSEYKKTTSENPEAQRLGTLVPDSFPNIRDSRPGFFPKHYHYEFFNFLHDFFILWHESSILNVKCPFDVIRISARSLFWNIVILLSTNSLQAWFVRTNGKICISSEYT